MRVRRIPVAVAFASALLALASCQGRRADGTPNGETVEVVIGTCPAADDTASSMAGISASMAETSAEDGMAL